ncbi:Fur-regulated basic protein FbpA [Aneurinibacillus sp. Ricciae_BoGa-3]
MEKYINQLLDMGVFKINERQLYECSEAELKAALCEILFAKRKRFISSY